ncbi:hypothetical protein N9B43_07535, partial [Mariniblastus sp.]|nr:hypothetical protein [Mariniblastus sp.]
KPKLAASKSKHANSFLSSFVRLLAQKDAQDLLIHQWSGFFQFLTTETYQLRQGVFPPKKGQKPNEN